MILLYNKLIIYYRLSEHPYCTQILLGYDRITVTYMISCITTLANICTRS